MTTAGDGPTSGNMAQRERLGHLIAQRRRALGLSAREAARRAGLARNTWESAEKGMRATSPANYAALEAALRWEPQSIERVLAGGDPVPMATPGPGPGDSAGLAETVLKLRELLPPGEAWQAIQATVQAYGEAVAEQAARDAGEEPGPAADTA